MTPFRLDTPAVVSFSGGRTSGLMLYRIIEAFGGTLPDEVKVIFNNTGKERPETLDFVERCSQRWGVSVTWLEYRYDGSAIPSPSGPKRKTPGRHTFAVMARFCTVELKIRTTNRYLKTLGDEWQAGYTNAIGLRADEPHRVARLKGTNRHNREEPVAPLHAAGLTLADVDEFWRRQPFRLELESHEGNCDLCFLKGAGKIRRVMQDRPDLAEWWIRMESIIEGGRCGTDRFRNDRPPYRIQLQLAQRPGLFDDFDAADELSVACHCTD